MHIQTKEAVAYKPTLARPLARNPHYGVGEARCGGCEPSIVRRRSCGRTTGSRLVARYMFLYIPQCGFLLCGCVLNRHDSLDLTCRARSASGCGRAARLGSKELRAQRRLDANVALNEYCCCVHIKYHVPGTWYLVQGADRET